MANAIYRSTSPVEVAWRPCTTLEELSEQTRLLYESITAARSTRTGPRAKRHKPAKAAGHRKSKLQARQPVSG
jgi:hypothetical protein